MPLPDMEYTLKTNQPRVPFGKSILTTRFNQFKDTMRTPIFIIAGFFLLAICASCDTPSNSAQGSLGAPTQGIQTSNQQATAANCISYNPENVITVPLGEYLRDAQRYQNVIGKNASKVLADIKGAKVEEWQGVNTRQVTFSLHRLKNFIAAIEDAAQQPGVNIDVDSLGITWTFAVYDSEMNHVFPSSGTDYRQQQTLYGVPSRLMGDNTVELVDILDKCKPVVDRLKSSGYAAADNYEFAALYTGGPNDIFNFGHLCPPNCSFGSLWMYENSFKNHGELGYEREERIDLN